MCNRYVLQATKQSVGKRRSMDHSCSRGAQRWAQMKPFSVINACLGAVRAYVARLGCHCEQNRELNSFCIFKALDRVKSSTPRWKWHWWQLHLEANTNTQAHTNTVCATCCTREECNERCFPGRRRKRWERERERINAVHENAQRENTVYYSISSTIFTILRRGCSISFFCVCVCLF